MSDPTNDPEKGEITSTTKFEASSTTSKASISEGQITPIKSSRTTQFWTTLRSELTETRGVSRVPPNARQSASSTQYIQMISLWTSANLTANHLALGLLGPKIYGLSFLDSALCATFGVLTGCLCTAYIATFGPQSGNRTMIVTRYHMGWWPSRLVVVLNLVIMIGYGMIDCVVGGQMISAVAGGQNLSIVVGVVIVAVVTWAITVIGLPLLHIYERYGWIPQAVALLILAGCAGPHFDLSKPSTGNGETITANRLSMFSLCLGATSAWAPAAADFYVYYPETTPKTLVFLLTWAGEALGYLFTLYLGIGIASGIPNNPTWYAANEISPGAILVASFDSLGGFGKFLATIVMLGVIANNAPGTYACGLGFQCLGSWPLRVPRMVWNSFAVLVYTVCAAVGRNHLYDIFQSFLSLMGYWCTIWVVITLEEQFIFRRKVGYNWTDWNDRSKLPIGLAALATFLLSYVGSVLGMYQTYFVGPIALMVGDYGSDLGLLIGLSWAAVLFPPLRLLEKKIVGR